MAQGFLLWKLQTWRVKLTAHIGLTALSVWAKPLNLGLDMLHNNYTVSQ